MYLERLGTKACALACSPVNHPTAAGAVRERTLGMYGCAMHLNAAVEVATTVPRRVGDRENGEARAYG